MQARRASRKVVYAALLGNLLVGFTKLAAALVTGSSAMVSEAVHSFVDTGNEVLLLYGLHRAARPPDERHPLGHGRELYFWSFIVTLVIFGLGAGVSIYEGVLHVLSPAPLTRPVVNYVVLGLALVFEAGSLAVADSKDPTIFIVLFEDSAALLGIVLALVGVAASEVLRLPVLDGVASIAIGVVLALVAAFLARESKGLLIGEPAESGVVASICAIARAQPGVEHTAGLFTVHLGPDQVVAAISVDFADELSAADVEAIVATLEERVRKAHPEIVSLLVKPQARVAPSR